MNPIHNNQMGVFKMSWSQVPGTYRPSEWSTVLACDEVREVPGTWRPVYSF